LERQFGILVASYAIWDGGTGDWSFTAARGESASQTGDPRRGKR
jgi:hypothetical protein